jgi:hypothetical protein
VRRVDVVGFRCCFGERVSWTIVSERRFLLLLLLFTVLISLFSLLLLYVFVVSGIGVEVKKGICGGW